MIGSFLQSKWENLCFGALLIQTISLLCIAPLSIAAEIKILDEYLEDDSCDVVLGEVFRELIRRGRNYGSSDLDESPPFVKYLVGKKIDNFRNFSEDHKKKTRIDYYKTHISKVTLNLNSLRQRSLRRSLQIYQVNDSGQDAYGVLRDLSSVNKARLLGASKDRNKIDAPGNESLRKLVDKISIAYAHMTEIEKISEDLPILSAKRLADMGLLYGLQNLYHFNTQILKSTDQVYFFSEPMLKTQIDDFNPFGYGDVTVRPKESHLQEYGWISPFLMYPVELREFLKRHDPRLYDEYLRFFGLYMRGIRLRESVRSEDVRMLENFQILKKSILGVFGRFTFTPRDFEDLLKTQVTASFLNLKETNRRTYLEVVKMLQQNDPSVMKTIIRDHFLIPLGMDSKQRFEAKIPVALPAGEFSVRGRK